MKAVYIPGTDEFLFAAKRLMERGELTKEQYEEMVRRNKGLSKETRYATLEVK